MLHWKSASLEICFIGEGRPEEWLVLCVRCRCQVTEKGRTVTHSTIKFHRCSEELMSEFHSVPMGLRHLLGSWKSVCSKSGNQDGLDNKRWIKTRIFFHTLFLDAYLQATRDWCTLLVLAIVISKRRNNNKTKQKTTQLHIPVLFPLVLLGSVFFASTTFCLVSTCNLYSFSKYLWTSSLFGKLYLVTQWKSSLSTDLLFRGVINLDCFSVFWKISW